MFFDNYPITTNDFTSTIFLQGLKASPAILLIHGYSATPYEMTWFAKQLNDLGYTVLVPRLPGHGTCKKDFLASSWKDWLRCVSDAYIDLSSKHENVYVGGHSMGALLATILSRYFDVKKLFLFAPAFKVINKGIPLPLMKFVKYFLKEVKRENITSFSEDRYNEAMKDYKSYYYMSKLDDFYKIQKMSIKALAQVRANTYVVLSKKDKLVPFSVKDFIDAKFKSKLDYLMLDRSSHFIFTDVEKEIVANKIIEFLN
ncbi:MAG: alpha/beta hydrolase [Treponema sp.]